MAGGGGREEGRGKLSRSRGIKRNRIIIVLSHYRANYGRPYVNNTMLIRLRSRSAVQERRNGRDMSAGGEEGMGGEGVENS